MEFELTKSSTEDVSQLFFRPMWRRLKRFSQDFFSSSVETHCFCWRWLKNCIQKGDLTGAPPVASIDSLASMKVLSAIVEICLLLKKFQCPCHGSNHILSWKALWYWRSIVVDMIHRDELDKTPWVAKDGAFTANRELVGVLLRWASTSA